MVSYGRNESNWRTFLKAARTGIVVLWCCVSIAPAIANSPPNKANHIQNQDNNSTKKDVSALSEIGVGALYIARRISYHHEAIEALSALAGLIFSGLLTLFNVGLWIETRNAARAARDTGNAAVKSNEISRDAMIADQRPWLYVNAELIAPIVWSGDKAGDIEFRLKIINSGKTPAIRVRLNFEIRRSDPAETIRIQQRCISAASAMLDTYAETIVPNEILLRDCRGQITASLFNSEHEGEPAAPSIFVSVIGVVVYKTIFGDADRISGFSFTVYSIDNATIGPANGDVPIDKLKIRRWSSGILT